MSAAPSIQRAPVSWAVWIAIILFIPIGLFLAIGGLWLIALGGSRYYAITGIAVLAAAWFLWRGRLLGVWIYAAMLVWTLIWTIWDGGTDFWVMLPRLAGPVILGLWLCLPAVWRKLK